MSTSSSDIGKFSSSANPWCFSSAMHHTLKGVSIVDHCSRKRNKTLCLIYFMPSDDLFPFWTIYVKMTRYAADIQWKCHSNNQIVSTVYVHLAKRDIWVVSWSWAKCPFHVPLALREGQFPAHLFHFEKRKRSYFSSTVLYTIYDYGPVFFPVLTILWSLPAPVS